MINTRLAQDFCHSMKNIHFNYLYDYTLKIAAVTNIFSHKPIIKSPSKFFFNHLSFYYSLRNMHEEEDITSSSIAVLVKLENLLRRKKKHMAIASVVSTLRNLLP